MATRGRALLKSWFGRGLYPAAGQFADWIDSFWHKDEDKIPVDAVENLPARLNDKYARTDGEELERGHNRLATDFAGHETANAKEFNNVYNNIRELEAADEEINAEIAEMHTTDTTLQTSLTNAHNDISTIREMLKSGAALAEAKTALVALGANYKDLYAVASTLKTFLQSKDTTDATINTWQEIESFLQGITDTQSLAALLSQLETKITAAYHATIATAVKTEKERAEAVESALDGSKVDKIAGKGLSAEDYTSIEKTKLAGVAAGANNYQHPEVHPASMITEDPTHRFATDTEKTKWNSATGGVPALAWKLAGEALWVKPSCALDDPILGQCKIGILRLKNRRRRYRKNKSPRPNDKRYVMVDSYGCSGGSKPAWAPAALLPIPFDVKQAQKNGGWVKVASARDIIFRFVEVKSSPIYVRGVDLAVHTGISTVYSRTGVSEGKEKVTAAVRLGVVLFTGPADSRTEGPRAFFEAWITNSADAVGMR